MSWVDPKCDVNRLHATNWPVSGITRRVMKMTPSQKSEPLIFNPAMREMAPQKHYTMVPKSEKSHTPSRGYTITSTSSIVVLGLCPMQMMSQDFGPRCCTDPMRWQSVESRVEVSWIDPIALVLARYQYQHWYQYLDWYPYLYALPQWDDFDKGKHTCWSEQTLLTHFDQLPHSTVDVLLYHNKANSFCLLIVQVSC